MNRLSSQRCIPARRSASLFGRGCLGWFLLLVVARGGLLFATDPLQLVPGDVAGIVVFRDVSATSAKLTRFVRRIHQHYEGFEFSAVSEKTLGLAADTIDTSRPIVVIVSKPEGLHNFLKRRGLDETGAQYPVVAFTPKQPAMLLKELRNRENRARRLEGPHGKYYLLMRDGVAFFSPQRKSLRILRGVGPETSVASTMGKEARSICEQSDVFVHIPLARWREKISPYVWMASGFIKLGIAAQQAPAEQEMTMAMADWFVDGARKAVDQMETLTLAMDFDGETFGLSHRFAFNRSGEYAEYIRQVRRSGFDLWKPLPDRPFVVLGILDWRCPPGSSLLSRLNTYFWNTDYARKAVPAQKRQKLLGCANACYGGMKGMQFIVTSPPKGNHPLQVYGGYATDDPAASFKQYCYIQENSQKALAALVPGGAAFTGDFKRRHHQEVDFLEFEFKLNQVPEAMRHSVVGVYGEGARVQHAVGGKYEVVYSVAQPPWGVLDQIEAIKTGRNVGKNPAVTRIRSRLPADAQAIVILDIGRLIGLLPHLAQTAPPAADDSRGATGREGQSKAELTKPGPKPIKVGPLLGWSCLAQDNALNCRLVIAADDLLEAANLVRSLAAHPPGPQAEPK